MGYRSPHHAREFLLGASLAVVHDYQLRCQRRTPKDKKRLLANTREIDLCARLASYFGPTANLAAQGTKDIDLAVTGPTIRAEVKYFRPPARHWASLCDDWEWLLGVPNTNDEFAKRAWVVFWPSTASGMYEFTQCLSVARSSGPRYAKVDFAPFVPYVEPFVRTSSSNERLRFKDPDRLTLIQLSGGKLVRVDVVGYRTAPLWCAIYTRTVPNANAAEAACTPVQISNGSVGP